jgi:hypothetical protein
MLLHCTIHFGFYLQGLTGSATLFGLIVCPRTNLNFKTLPYSSLLGQEHYHQHEGSLRVQETPVLSARGSINGSWSRLYQPDLRLIDLTTHCFQKISALRCIRTLQLLGCTNKGIMHFLPTCMDFPWRHNCSLMACMQETPQDDTGR